MKLRHILIFIALGLLLAACSGSVNTAVMTPEEHLEYAKGLYTDEDYEECLREFQNITLQYPGSAVNDDAQYYLAMTYFQREEFILAAYEYSKLIRDIPASQFVPDAQFMLAESYYQLSPNFQLDQAYSKKSIEEFQTYIEFFPLSTKVEDAEKKIKELNVKLASKEMKNAYIYERMSYINAAIIYYDMIVDTYHDTEFAPSALYNKIKLLIDKERLTEARKDISTFLRRYPDAKEAMDVAELENELNNN